ncbi:2-hydroxychromene-2-carboxylate isomerase [Sneathiella limimaris]|uniref:2-hydroxychromene-2-carboxylate isomerase n=1 Tax=Sneathiella limimaris TaxID=1964213 RepID=UPI001469E26D|nr:2-hydroxychromene-2-carboxylate isomerase [Sneathiella limimaris]
MSTLEFFFDCSSPWTYLGFEGLQDLLTRHTDLDVIYKPILVGGVFNAVNPSVYASRENPVPAKQIYSRKDMKDWAELVGIEIGQPPVFPVNSVKAMRGAFVALEEDCLVPYARAVFKRYWTDLADISQEEILSDIVTSVGMDKTAYFEKINDQTYKDKLKDTTQELIDRGGFGSPTLYLDRTDMYFGNDRLQLIEAKLNGSRG